MIYYIKSQSIIIFSNFINKKNKSPFLGKIINSQAVKIIKNEMNSEFCDENIKKKKK